MASYLAQLELNYDSDDSEHGISLKEVVPGFQIDRGSKSVTRLPAFRTLEGTPYVLYDLPGLEDTRGADYELLNVSFIKNIVENADEVGFIFVEDRGTLWSKWGQGLKTLIDWAQQVFEVDESNSLLVVTKVKQNWDAEKIMNNLSEDFADEFNEGSLLK